MFHRVVRHIEGRKGRSLCGALYWRGARFVAGSTVCRTCLIEAGRLHGVTPIRREGV